MKFQILSALCFSLFMISCNGIGNTEIPAEPVKTAPLSKIEVTVGSGTPRTYFEAGYDNGIITSLNISDWRIDISENMKGPEELPISDDLSVIRKTCGVLGPMKIVYNGVERFTVKYENEKILLHNENGGADYTLIKDNSGMVVSVVRSEGGNESESMALEYDSSERLITVIEKNNIVDGSKSLKTSFIYKNGYISYAEQTTTFYDGTVQKVEIELKDFGIRNSQGILLPVFDNSGMLTVLSALDVIGAKSVLLPKTINIRTVMDPTFPVASMFMDTDYRIGSDDYLESIDMTCEFKIPGLVDIRNTIDYAYTFER